MATINSINNNTTSGGITIDPGSSGDSFIQFDINTTGKFRVGVDDDDSDKFKISGGSALGTNDFFIITSAGEVIKPYQPAFLAADAALTNVTGDGTDYTVNFSTGSEYFDQNGDFDGTSTFTAPVTGKYVFISYLYFTGLTSSHTYAQITLSTSNRDYVTGGMNPWAVATSLDNYACCIGVSVLADMDASDTAVIKLLVSGGTKVVDISGINRNMFFCGYLAC